MAFDWNQVSHAQNCQGIRRRRREWRKKFGIHAVMNHRGAATSADSLYHLLAHTLAYADHPARTCVDAPRDATAPLSGAPRDLHRSKSIEAMYRYNIRDLQFCA